jgi:hypothetical protein
MVPVSLFVPIYQASTRIQVVGYNVSMTGLRFSFDNKMGDSFWPIKFEELSADIQFIDKLRHGFLETNGTEIDTIPLIHPQSGLGVRLNEDKKTLIF